MPYCLLQTFIDVLRIRLARFTSNTFRGAVVADVVTTPATFVSFSSPARIEDNNSLAVGASIGVSLKVLPACRPVVHFQITARSKVQVYRHCCPRRLGAPEPVFMNEMILDTQESPPDSVAVAVPVNVATSDLDHVLMPMPPELPAVTMLSAAT